MTEETALGAWYRLVEEIGHGAAGVVWRAVDTRTDQTVAAKLLRPEHASDPRLVERFVRERSLLMSLRDEAVVAVRDLVVEGDRLAIISDYMPEGSLRSRLEESGPFSPRLAARVTAVVLDGVDAARAAGIVHRDLKPDNVLLAPGWQEAEPGSVRVTDFGISRLMTDTRRSTTGLVGTPEYMPPELLIAGEAGFPADVYAAGILLYELLAGRTPFAGPGTDYTVAHRHVVDPPPPLPVPEELWTLVSDMLAKAPEARPTAAEAAASLRRMAPGLDDDGPIETSAVAPLRDADHPPTVLRGIDGHRSGRTGTRYRLARRSTGPERAGGSGAFSGPGGSGGSGVAGSKEVVAPVPDLGEPTGQTVLRPIRAPRPDREPGRLPMATGPWWRNRRVLVPVAAGLAIVVIAVVALAVHGLGGRPSAGPRIPSPAATQQVSATQQDDPLPTGLGISRRASYDPQTRRISLTLTYSAEKAPLAGPMLEVLPGAKSSAECPAVVWTGAGVSENLPTTTGIDAACGWACPGEGAGSAASRRHRSDLPGARCPGHPAGPAELVGRLRPPPRRRRWGIPRSPPPPTPSRGSGRSRWWRRRRR
jgi:serine/threonine-protein kinase